MRLTHPEAELSTEPDSMFITDAAIRERRAWIEKGPIADEIVGSADVVVEVHWTDTAERDQIILRECYAAAGIREYWLVDPRKKEPRLDILRLTPRGYKEGAQRRGWVKSAVFGRSFKLTGEEDKHGLPDYNLEVR